MHGEPDHLSLAQACDIRLRVIGDELIEPPVHEASAGGRNWLAVVEADPASPDGMARIGLSPTPDGGFLLPGRLAPGTVLESGAERVDGTGQSRHRTVRYGVVVLHDDRRLVLRPADGVTHALAGAAFLAAARTGRPSPAQPSAMRQRRPVGGGLVGAAVEADRLLRRLERLARGGALEPDAAARTRAAAAQVALAARMLRAGG